MTATFLTLDEVLALHADQIERYGGRAGIRDLGLLSSAVATAQASYGDSYLHSTLHEMAAAYLFHIVFHIVKNHAFIDGNKRAGLIAALAFLGLNHVEIDADPDALYQLVIGVADGTVTKAQVAVFLQANSRGP